MPKVSVKKDKIISEAIIKRLPRYYRILKALNREGVQKINSGSLADMMSITASQVRQDIYTFGGHGMQGYGYEVEGLLGEIGALLGLNRRYSVIVIGAGRIGTALAAYSGFAEEGFFVECVFDIATEGRTDVCGKPLRNMSELKEYLVSHDTDIAIIATGKDSARSVADTLVEYGIKAIWNFAPTDITVSQSGVCVENINMSESLFVLSFRMNNK